MSVYVANELYFKIYKCCCLCISNYLFVDVDFKDARSVSWYPYNRRQTSLYMLSIVNALTLQKELHIFMTKMCFRQKSKTTTTTKLKRKNQSSCTKGGCVTSRPTSQLKVSIVVITNAFWCCIYWALNLVCSSPLLIIHTYLFFPCQFNNVVNRFIAWQFMLLFMCLDDVLCTNLNKSSICLSVCQTI